MNSDLLDLKRLLELDRDHIWHPYSAMPAQQPVYPVASAAGAVLTLADGRSLIDGMSSWWSAIHGYNHPRLNAAAHRQIDAFSHVMFGGLTHQPAADLVQRLLAMMPEALNLVFLCDSGSVSVEVALKMAIQYWQAQGEVTKTRFLALQGGYHGDTFGAMSVCDPVNGMHHLFTQVLPQHYFAPRPECRYGDRWQPENLQAIETTIEQHSGQIAAVILEPIVQGAGGMWFYHPQYLTEIRRLCDRHRILLIADEIATGFGRTGKLFACEHAGIVADILCLGKALTGGYLSLAATLTKEHIGRTLSAGEADCFMHGPTFMGNPLACSIAAASLDLLLENDWQAQVRRIETGLRTKLECCRNLPGVADVRVLGAIGVVEMNTLVDVPVIQEKLIQQGVWLRPFGRLIYTMPPYIITDQQLNVLCKAVYRALGG